MRCLAGAAFALASATSSSARADDPAPTRSYAWQTLAVDGAAVAAGTTIVISAFATDQLHKPWVGPSVLASTGVYLVGAPAIHLAHGRPAAAAKSFGLRLVGPPVGLLIGGGIGLVAGIIVGGCPGFGEGRCKRETAGQIVFGTGVGLGLLAGFGGPSVIDALVLAREPAPQSQSSPVPPAQTRTTPFVTPSLALLPGGGLAGVAGSF